MSQIPVKVRHRTDANLFYETTSEVSKLTPQQRLKTGAKLFSFCLLAALIFVVIPILHFVLVPGALFIGVFLFFRSFGLTDYRKDFSFACPKCKKPISVKDGPFNWPISTECPDCRSEIVIDKLSPA